MLTFKFLPRFSFLIFVSFILFTVIGTISHEFGHIAVAKYHGYDTELHFGSMEYYHKGFYDDEMYLELKSLNEKYTFSNNENIPIEILERIDYLNNQLMKKYPSLGKNDTFFVTLGGPLQTTLTSLVGLSILFYRRKKNFNFKALDWLGVFLSLFILREVFNFVSAIYSTVFYAKRNFNGDEFVISRLLGLNEWIIPSLMLIVGVLISFYVIFRIIPLKYRFSFIVSGFVGGLLGFAIWFGFLGEFVFSYL